MKKFLLLILLVISGLLHADNWTGTGWALKKGYIVTNFHCVDGAKSIVVETTESHYSAKVVATDPSSDLAIVKIDDGKFSGFGEIPYSIERKQCEVGETVWTLGFPMTSIMGDEVKFTDGKISAKTGYMGDLSTYQITVPIHPGNSGGPLFNKNGNIVGVTSSGLDKQLADNVNYAIKANYLLNLIESALSVDVIPNGSAKNLALTEYIRRNKKFVFLLHFSSEINENTTNGISTETIVETYPKEPVQEKSYIAELFDFEIISKDKVRLTKLLKDWQEIEIPASVLIDGQKFYVTEIGARVFQQNQTLKTITLPNTIEKIGDAAFFNTGIANLYFKGTIADWANIHFSDWSSNPVSSYTEFYLNNTRFEGNKLILPNSTKRIGSYSFRNFDQITSIEIPNSVTRIEKSAFIDCDNLTSVIIPKSVNNIENKAFGSCNSLVNITVEDGNPKYDSRENCNAIIETQTNTLIAACNKSIIPNTIQKIGGNSFYDCDRLKSLILPTSIEGIGVNAFESCDSLVSIKLNEGLKYIGSEAFIYCSSLETMEIPNTVTNIGGGVFCCCSKLKSVKLSNRLTSLPSAPSEYSNSIPIGMFAQCKSLTEVIIPNSVTYIGDYAFYDCTSLTSLSIPSSITTVGRCAFSYIPSLKYVTIHNAPKDMVFFQCPSLTHITWNVKSGVDSQKPFDRIKNQVLSFTFGENVEYIPKELCYGMSNLQSIEIPKNIKRIGYNAFYYCDKLTSVTWNATDCTIEDYVFYASKIKSFTFGENVKVIPEALCKGMSSLTSITIPNNVQKIGKNVFEECTNITSVEWNAHSTCAVQLENNRITSPFSSIATQITSISFGNSVETIPACLCIGMTELETIEIPQSVTSIGQDAFCDCYGLKKITIPKSVIEIGPSAFKHMGGYADIQVVFCGKVNPENIFQFQRTWIRKDYTFYVPAEYLRYYKSFSKKQLGISKGSVRYKTF